VDFSGAGLLSVDDDFDFSAFVSLDFLIFGSVAGFDPSVWTDVLPPFLVDEAPEGVDAVRSMTPLAEVFACLTQRLGATASRR
jgi:hypothetical protein